MLAAIAYRTEDGGFISAAPFEIKRPEEGEEKLHLLMLDNHIPAGAKMY